MFAGKGKADVYDTTLASLGRLTHESQTDICIRCTEPNQSSSQRACTAAKRQCTAARRCNSLHDGKAMQLWAPSKLLVCAMLLNLERFEQVEQKLTRAAMLQLDTSAPQDVVFYNLCTTETFKDL